MIDIYQYPVVKHINSGVVSSSTVSLPTNSLTYYLELTDLDIKKLRVNTFNLVLEVDTSYPTSPALYLFFDDTYIPQTSVNQTGSNKKTITYSLLSKIDFFQNKTSVSIGLFNISQTTYSLYTHNSSYVPRLHIIKNNLFSYPKSDTTRTYDLADSYFSFDFNYVLGMGVYRKVLFNGLLPYEISFLFNPIDQEFKLSVIEKLDVTNKILHNNKLRDTVFTQFLEDNKRYIDSEGSGLVLESYYDDYYHTGKYRIYHILKKEAKKIFNLSGYLEKIINESGKEITFSYQNNELTTITDYLGNVVKYEQVTINNEKVYQISLNNCLVYSFTISTSGYSHTYTFKEYDGNSIFKTVTFNNQDYYTNSSMVIGFQKLELTYNVSKKKITKVQKYSTYSGTSMIEEDTFNYDDFSDHKITLNTYKGLIYHFYFDDDYRLLTMREYVNGHENDIFTFDYYFLGSGGATTGLNNGHMLYVPSNVFTNQLQLNSTNPSASISTGETVVSYDIESFLQYDNTYIFKFYLTEDLYYETNSDSYIDADIYLKRVGPYEGVIKHITFKFSCVDNCFIASFPLTVETGVSFERISMNLHVNHAVINVNLDKFVIYKVDQYANTYYYLRSDPLLTSYLHEFDGNLLGISYVSNATNNTVTPLVNEITKEDILYNQILDDNDDPIIVYNGLKSAVAKFTNAKYILPYMVGLTNDLSCYSFVLVNKTTNFGIYRYNYLLNHEVVGTNIDSLSFYTDGTFGSHLSYEKVDYKLIIRETLNEQGEKREYSVTNGLVSSITKIAVDSSLSSITFSYNRDNNNRLTSIYDSSLDKTINYTPITTFIANASIEINNKTTSYAYNSTSTYNYINSMSMGSSANLITQSGNTVNNIGTSNKTITFTYDKYGFKNTISIGSTTYLFFTNQILTSGDTKTITTSNSYSVTYNFDKYGRPLEVKEGTTLKTKYQYALRTYETSTPSYDLNSNISKSLLKRVYDYYQGEIYNFFYNDKHQVNEIRRYGSTSVSGDLETVTSPYHKYLSYNTHSQLSYITISSSSPLLAFNYHKSFSYDIHDELEGITSYYQIGGNNKVMSSGIVKDTFGRISQTQITVGGNTATKTYTYNGLTTTIVTSFSNNVNTLTETIIFDKNGNIVSHVKSGLESSSMAYTYDNCNRLYSEYNGNLHTYYSYDIDGNISSVTKTTGNPPFNFTSYTYSTTFKDLLTKFSLNENFIYDSFLNPLTFGNNHYTYTRGRLLETFKVGNGQTTYFKYYYDKDGIRYKKSRYIYNSSSGTFTEQDYIKYHIEDGNVLVEDRIDNNTHTYIYYYYGMTGIEGFYYNNTRYTYLKDGLNNIIAILDESFSIVARYSYDAYGNTSVKNPDGSSNTSSSFIGNINPFRYKCYYYDIESSMYYCKSRYYVPEIRRWLNADDFSYLDESQIDGLNLFAYCKNNPLIYEDPEGTVAGWVIGLLIGVGVLATVGTGFMVGGMITNNEIMTNVGDSLISAAEIAGGIVLIASGLNIKWGISFISTGAGSVAGGVISVCAGGSFHSSWVGGQIVGLISLIPVSPLVTGSIGSFFGSVVSDFIDSKYNWREININKAVVFALIGFALSSFSNIVDISGVDISVTEKLIISRNSFLLDVINSIIDSFWDKNKAEKKWEKKK